MYPAGSSFAENDPQTYRLCGGTSAITTHSTVCQFHDLVNLHDITQVIERSVICHFTLQEEVRPHLDIIHLRHVRSQKNHGVDLAFDVRQHFPC